VSLLNLETLRVEMKKCLNNPPVIPVIELYIPKIQECYARPALLSNGMVDFDRLRALARIFEEMETCVNNNAQYSFVPIQLYLQFLDQEIIILDEKSILKHSKSCESQNSSDALL